MAPNKVTEQASVGVPLGGGEWVFLLAQTSTLALLPGLGALRDKLGEEGRRSRLCRETRNPVESLMAATSLRLRLPLTTAFWQEWTDMAWPTIWLLLPALVAASWSAQSRTPQAGMDLLNVRMDTKHHKTKPGPEDKLHGQMRTEWSHGLGES